MTNGTFSRPRGEATLVTVLRSGGRYDRKWVERLALGARRFAGFDRIVCLTDTPFEAPGIETVALCHDWPTWWAKIEAFRPGLSHGTTVLCDLDTVFASDASALSTPGLAVMADHFHPDRMSSALMRWHGDELSFIYDTFAADPERWMSPGSCGAVPNAVHGDQVVIDFLLREKEVTPRILQALHPGLIDFYGADKTRFGPVVVFIGDAKPDVAVEPIRSVWRGESILADA